MTHPPRGRQLSLQTWRWVGVLLVQSGQCICSLQTTSAIKTSVSRRSRKEVAATKKNPKQFTHLGFGSLLPQSGFFSWAAGVGGWGAAQLGLIRPHLATHRAYSMPRGVLEHDNRRRIAEHLARVDHGADRHTAGRVSQRTISQDSV